MPKRHFNWKLAIVLGIGFAVLSLTAFGLRQWHRNRRIERALEAGNKAYNQQNWQEAARYLGSYIGVMRDDVPALLKYAEAQLNIRPVERNNIKQAIAAYRIVLRTDKNNYQAAMQLAEIYLGLGMAGEVELIATRALETSQSPKLRRMLAIALANQRKFEEAAEELKKIIKEHPDQVLAYDVLSRLIEQRPEVSSQTPQYWYNEAIKNNPSEPQAYIIRGAYHLKHNRRTKALEDLTLAEQKDLSVLSTRLQLAQQFINANALDKAQKHLQVVQTSNPDNQLLWQTWAQLALKSNSKTIMLKVAETGLKELSSQPWDFMPTAAKLYIRCNKLDLAEHCISKLRQKDVAPRDTAFLEGLLADKKGQGYEAVKHWQWAMELGNESPRIQLALASTLSRLGDVQSALRQLRNLVSERPDFFEGRLALAKLLAKTGNWAEAAEQANVAMQISPDTLDVALLHIQARIQLFAENKTPKNALLWQDIEERLAVLENIANDALEVRIVQFQLVMQQGDFADAEMLVAELRKAYPSQIKVDLAEVDLLRAMDKTDQVVIKLYGIIEKFPNLAEPVEYLAALLDQKNKREECEGIIKNALSCIENSVTKRNLSLLLANFYHQWGRQEEAYVLLTSLQEKLPNDVPVKKRLLKYQQITKNSAKAQQLVDEIKAIEGEKGWQWRYEQAKIWFQQHKSKDRHPQIISLLQENLLANPDDQASRILLAATYERAGQLQLAISTYNEALNRSPRDIRIIVPIVAAFYKANEYDRADEILRRAASEKLFHPELKKLELQSHLRRGRLSSASDILENLLTDDPNNASICLSLALLKMRQNKFTEAGQLLDKLKIQTPGSLPVTAAQIQLNTRRRKPEEAIRLCNEVVDNLNNALAHILRARTFASLGQTGKAIVDFEYAATIEPDSVKVWMAKSDFYRSIGRPDKAIADIQQALSLAPHNIQIQKRAISLFLTSGNNNRVRQARVILGEALQSDPEDIELQLFKAHLLLAQTTAPSVEQAAAILQKIIEDQPETGQAWLLLGEIYLKSGQFGKAIDVALQGLAHKLNDKPLLLLKVRAEAARSPALAVPTLRALQQLDPNNADTAVLLASTYSAAGEPQRSVNLLKEYLLSCSAASDKRKVNLALAVALHKNTSKTKSREIFDLLYQTEPNDPAPLLAQALLLKDDQLWDRLNQMVYVWCQSHPEDTHTPVTIAKDLAVAENSQAKKIAEDILRMILKNHYDCAEAMSALAMLLQMTDRFAESVALYNRILAVQPDNLIAINNLAWILCEEQAQHQQALELAQQGLEKAPHYVDLIDTRGVAYYRLGQFNKAERDFNQCINLYPRGTPSVVTSYFHLAKTLVSLGQKNKAIENLKKTLDLNTEIGGLSAADFAEARRLLEELTQGV